MKFILIVDNSPLIRRSLRTLFEQQPDIGICAEADNGSDGMDKARAFHPDLIVMDLAMPRLNGIDASRMIKRLMPTTPIVMFTTFTNPFIKEAALAAGVQAVIDKSEGATTLIRSIQQLLSRELRLHELKWRPLSADYSIALLRMKPAFSNQPAPN